MPSLLRECGVPTDFDLKESAMPAWCSQYQANWDVCSQQTRRGRIRVRDYTHMKDTYINLVARVSLLPDPGNEVARIFDLWNQGSIF